MGACLMTKVECSNSRYRLLKILKDRFLAEHGKIVAGSACMTGLSNVCILYGGGWCRSV